MNYFRWSRDGGRTWEKAVSPKEWLWEDSWEGKTYVRGVSEGSVVRAKNGWLVAALRTDMPARWIADKNDNYEGCAVSISKDNGQTWSPLKILHRGGRMHMHFVKTPDGALVMIYVMRQDIAPDGIHYASYRRGCCALVSRDNGLTWDLSREHRRSTSPPSEGRIRRDAPGLRPHLFHAAERRQHPHGLRPLHQQGHALIRWNSSATIKQAEQRHAPESQAR